MTLDQVLAKLRDARSLLDDYAVESVGVFGSVARGEAGPDSDVDLLVEFEPGRTPGLRFFELERRLSQLMGTSVDLLTLRGLREPLRSSVLKELVYA